MIDVAAIADELRALIQGHAAVDFLAQPVGRGEYVNMDPDAAPWVGVYRSKVEYVPRTLGRGAQSWQGKVTFRVLVQESTTDSGRDCEDLLESHVNKVLTAVLSDRTLSNTVDMLNSLNVNYSYNETERETLFFQNAEIVLEYEVTTA